MPEQNPQDSAANTEGIPYSTETQKSELAPFAESVLGPAVVSSETAELEAPKGMLPAREELKLIVEVTASGNIPSKVRLQSRNESPNVLYTSLHQAEDVDFTDPTVLQQVHRDYVEYKVGEAEDAAWWITLQENVKTQNPPVVKSKHVIEVQHGNEPTQDHYDIFEVGDGDITDSEREAIFETVKLIDQFTGGYFSGDKHRKPIVVGSGLKMKNAHGTQEQMVGGFDERNMTFINIDMIRQEGIDWNLDPNTLLKVILVHEVLGHGVEKEVEEYSGDQFRRLFDYSVEKIEGDMFMRHVSVTPKTIGVQTSPVREYGYANGSEDRATTVDASMAKIMGWDTEANQSPRSRSVPDEYRWSEAFVLLEYLAEMAAGENGKPGIVGCAIGQDTETGNMVPLRTFRSHTIDGSEAAELEMKKVIDACKADTELIVQVDTPIF